MILHATQKWRILRPGRVVVWLSYSLQIKPDDFARQWETSWPTEG